MARSKAPRGEVYEIDAGVGTGAEVGDRHLWLIISGPEVHGDRLVIGLPLTGRDEMRTNYDVPYRPDQVEELRSPIRMSLKKEGLCYVLTSKPRHFSVTRLPTDPYGKMDDAVIATALQRMGHAMHFTLRTY